MRAAGDDGIILFENAAEHAAAAGRLRRDGFHVIGGSAYGDRLENDRASRSGAGDLGLPIAACGTSTAQAADFPAPSRALRAEIQRADQATITRPRCRDGRDVRALLAAAATTRPAPFIHWIMSTAWRWVSAPISTARIFCRLPVWTGSTSVLSRRPRRAHRRDGHGRDLPAHARFLARTLALVEPLLREHGHFGYVNLNTIVNQDGIWPLDSPAASAIRDSPSWIRCRKPHGRSCSAA